MLGEEKQLIEKDDAESINEKDGINLTKIITDKDKSSEIFTSDSSKENLIGSSSVSSLSNSDHSLNGPILVNKSEDKIINDNSTGMLSEIMKNGNAVKNTGNSDAEENTENTFTNCSFIPSCNAASHESSLTLQRNCVSSNENCDSFQNHTESENINTGKRKREEPEENRETKVAKIDNEILSPDVRKRKSEDADENLETKVLKSDNNDKSSSEKCISLSNENEEKKENLVVSRLNALPSKNNVEDETFKDNSLGGSIENECEKMSEKNKEEIYSEKRVDYNDHVEDPEESKRETQGDVEVCNKETIIKDEESQDKIQEIKIIKENSEELSYDKEVAVDEHRNEHDKTLEESKEKASYENRVCTPNEHVDHEKCKMKTQDDNVEDSNEEIDNESQNKICKKETMKEVNEKVSYNEEKSFDEHDNKCEKTSEKGKEVLNESRVEAPQEDAGSKEIEDDVEDSSRETTAENEETLNKICEKENSKEIIPNETKNLDEGQKGKEKTSKESKEEISFENRVDTPDGPVKDSEDSEKETPEEDVENSNTETIDKIEEPKDKTCEKKMKENSEVSYKKKEETIEEHIKDFEENEENTKVLEESTREAVSKFNESEDGTFKKINKEAEEKSYESKEETHNEENIENTQSEDIEEGNHTLGGREEENFCCDKSPEELKGLEKKSKDHIESKETSLKSKEENMEISKETNEESTGESVGKFNESEDGTFKKINKEAEEEKSYESKGETHNEENIENTQSEDIEEGNRTLGGSEEENFGCDKSLEELKGLEEKSKDHIESKETSLKSKEENMEISKETNEDNDREINNKSEESLAETVESHKSTQQSIEKETAEECRGREIDVENSLAVGEKGKELDEDHIQNIEDVSENKNDDDIMNNESPSKDIDEFEGFENKSAEDGNDDKDGTELKNIIIGEAFTINEEQMIEMDNLRNEEPVQSIKKSSQTVSAAVKATSIRHSVKDGSPFKKKSLGKASRRYKKITFKTKRKKKYVYPSTSSAAQYIPVKTELNLPLFLEELANIDPKLIIIRDRYNEDGKKFKVHCISFHETVLDWALSETLLSSFDNSKILRKKLKLKMNGYSMFPENLEPKIGETHPISLGNAFPFAMPKIGVKCESDAAEEVRLSFPLEQLGALCPSALGCRDTDETKPRRLNSVLFADEPLEWAFKETFLSSFEDSPILSDLLGLTSSTTKWPDVTEEILSNEGVDYTFPFACPNNGKRMYESLLFSNLSTDLPSSLLHETLQLPPLPSNIEKNLYGERDSLVRLLAIASFYKHSSCIPTIRSNRKLSSIHSALIESFRPLIISQANKLAVVIRKAREWLLKGVTCQDASIIPAMIDGPINSKRGNLFSHLQKLEAAVAKDLNNKLQNM